MPYARIAVDHGALALAPNEVPSLLAAAALDGIELQLHPSGGLYVDPVLRVLERLWESADAVDFADAEWSRRHPLSPLAK